MNEDAEDVLPEAPSVDIPADVPDPIVLLVLGQMEVSTSRTMCA